jgi:chromatin remodeling complex protein RSC6
MATAKKAASKKSASAKSGAAKTSAAKKGGASAAKKSGGAAAKSGGRKPNAAFMKAMQPSEQLAAVVGNKPMPRTEVTKKLWEYIKKNDLQDAKNRRQINADERLKPIFGNKKSVTMFEITKLVNDHLSDA